uniref:JAK Janus kinase n=1 Tax=Phallusia mammillata TaxID=59560 RepID=A0A6F9DET0_9ASCI|nr:JAK Janus kinase [Phallusia mammillata]
MDNDNQREIKIVVKLFQTDSNAEDGGTVYQKHLVNSTTVTISQPADATLETVFQACAEKCQISPIYISLFGLKDSDTGLWVNFACTISSYIARKKNFDSLHLEFRVRYIFTNDCPGTTGQQHLAYRFSVENGRKHDVMNDTVLRYLFFQQRDDFREGKLKISENVLDEDSANLGIAVLDLLRLACELQKDLRTVVDHVSLKKMVSRSYADWLSTRHMLRKIMIKHRFQHYVGHFEERYRQCLDARSTALYFHIKYLKNLEILMGSQNVEEYAVVSKSQDPDECNKISIGPYCEIVKHSNSQMTGSKWCGFSDLADLKLTSKEVNGVDCWTVTLVHISGDVLSVVLASLAEAESLASCIDGYYHLLVDTHHYLCKQVCRPSLVEELSMSCHGPISSSFSTYILKKLSRSEVGDCLLRRSHEKFGEYFINAIDMISHTNREVTVRNYKLDRASGLLGETPTEDSRPNGLAGLLEEFQNHHGNNLPFNIKRLVYPAVGQPNALLIHRENIETRGAADSHTDMTIIPQGAYKFQKHLGGGRFTEVTLCSKRDQRSDEVVVKKVYESEDPGLQQSIESSFEDSMIKFRQLNNWMDVEGKNKNIYIVQLKGTIMSKHLVLEYVPHGSIVKYAQQNREFPGAEWIMSVIWQLAHACAYLESKNCAHGNIRGKNVLLKHTGDHPFIKLGDPGVRTCQRNLNNKIVVEPSLSAPWLAYEYCLVDFMPSTAIPSINGDKWSFATTVCEICHWSLSSSFCRPENAYGLKPNLKERYRDQEQPVVSLPDMLMAPELKTVRNLLMKCWSIWPENRPAFRHILRELGAVSSNFDYQNVELPQTAPEEILPDLDVYDDQNLMTVRSLGNGHFGYVDLCQYDRYRNGQNEPVAVKSLIRNANNQKYRNILYNEIQTMRQINHRYVVKLKGVTFPSVRIVMEYLACGPLGKYLRDNSGKMPLQSLFHQLYVFSSQISDGMQALQEHRLIHRDLALRNILLNRDGENSPLYVKISDFGLSRVVNEEESYYRGNLDDFPALWYAPECLCPSDISVPFQFESDVWSFGITIWEMFSFGEKKPRYPSLPSVKREDIGKLRELLSNGERLLQPEHCPPEVYDIMGLCWQFNPQARIGFNDLQQRFIALAGNA